MNALISRPAIAALLLGLVTVLAAVCAVATLGVEGDVARALKGTSEEFRAHTRLEAEFGAPSKDEVFLVRADNFGDADSLQALEDLVVDLQLTEGVRAVLSLFTLPDPAGEGVSFLSRSDVGALPPAKRLERLLAVSPLSRYFLSQDHSAVLLTVLPDLSVPTETRLANIRDTTGFAAPGLTVKSVSLAALQREISIALIDDQLFVTPTATLFCVLLALVLFRSWRAAILCALPALAGVAWTLGAMVLLRIPFDPLMAIVPTILIVLGIADSVHVFHAVMRCAEEMDLRRAIVTGLSQTLPAVVLAAATTALAFLCLLLIGSPTVANLAIIGPIGLVLTTLAVVLLIPPATVLLFANRPSGFARPHEFGAVTGAAIRLLRLHRLVALAALLILAALFVAQTRTVMGYRLTDHIPRNGDFRANLQELQEVLPGSDQNFAIVNAADPAPGISDADKALIDRASAALYGAQSVFVQSDNPDAIDNALLARFQAQDGSAFALPVIGRLDVPWTETLAQAEAARADLARAGINDVSLTGYSLMASVELPLVVKELRYSFYIAVVMVTVLATFMMKSARVAGLSLIPNLIPILGVEAWLALTGQPLTITGAIAFIIAFGIAVDDTIHLMNRMRVARKPGAPLDRAVIEDALRSTAAPVITTSIVLLSGFVVTSFSLLPSVSLFGQLTAAAMMLALIADLFLFPSLLLWGHKGARKP